MQEKMMIFDGNLFESNELDLYDKIILSGITFDDVLLLPQYSEISPSEVCTDTLLTKNIQLKVPLLSAPMDTVTESDMAIALAKEGGIGIIHKNMTIEEQIEEIAKVKRSANGIINNPIVLPPTAKASTACDLMDSANISGIPIVAEDHKLVGIITRRDLRFLEDKNMLIKDVMTKDNLTTIVDKNNITLEEAEKILLSNKVEKLLLTDDQGKLTGMITIRDIDIMNRFPNACKDSHGRLRVGAAVGVNDFERIDKLTKHDVDVLIVDSAHGHSKNVLNTVRFIKSNYDIDVIAGNVATAEAAEALIKSGVDAIKVGIGPGSICTTRVISGVGVPQITAVMEACSIANKSDTPVIADGGIRYSGDITKAIAAGAKSVMIGGLFAGLTESPGDKIIYQGRAYKAYRGMGSIAAMKKGSSDRYRQKDICAGKLVPEGVEGRVPYKGNLSDFVYQLVGGLRSGMGYVGAADIEQLRMKSRFVRVSAAGIAEGHPHDITITQEASNYSTEK